MKTKKHPVTLLAIADDIDFDAYRKLTQEWERHSRYNLNFVSLSYSSLLDNDIPHINTERIIVFLFFPFEHWNREIEPKDYKGIYGSKSFYKKFISFWNLVDISIKRNFADKRVYFVNPPSLSGKYRDKLLVKNILQKADISTPKLYKFRSIKDIYGHLNAESNLFLKVRYGSMGKGITFLSRDKWQTNFTYRNKRILSRKSDYGWTFKDVTGNHAFLRALLKKDIYIEGAILSPIVDGKIFDLRIYSFFGKAIYVYPRSNDFRNLTTNISQGGKGQQQSFLRSIPGHLIALAKKEAMNATEALGINFAGVDVVIDRNLKDVYIYDVNLFPGFPRLKIYNLSRRLIEELEGIFKQV